MDRWTGVKQDWIDTVKVRRVELEQAHVNGVDLQFNIHICAVCLPQLRKEKLKRKKRNQEFHSCIANVLALATGGQLWTKSVNVTLIPPTITSGPPGSWITRVCQYPRPEKKNVPHKIFIK